MHKAKVLQSWSPAGFEWVAIYADGARWFTRWADAYAFAYTCVRLRNTVFDALDLIDEDEGQAVS